MGEYEEVSFKLGRVSRHLTASHAHALVLLRLLERSAIAFRKEEDYHGELFDYELLKDIEKELSLWKTERVTEHDKE